VLKRIPRVVCDLFSPSVAQRTFSVFKNSLFWLRTIIGEETKMWVVGIVVVGITFVCVIQAQYAM